ncbi:MAG: aminotransferase class I/II-fold pyridoxal phosphate-dependent enzyme [Firmicutes bacterium]|nr:aminotransferase class I/II-fold pyridoxal phosphate-dependent enzyme [Bacillota bacterium]
MNNDEFITHNFGIDKELINLSKKVLSEVEYLFKEIDETAEFNQLKVLSAMQKNRVGEAHFSSTTGYGYNDLGRDALEDVYADIFRAESALVRPQLISGTHALYVALSGNLRPGDEIFSPAGLPYDTLQGVIGIREEKGSLKEYGITFNCAELIDEKDFDYDAIKKGINEKTRLILIQRSKGYTTRQSLSIDKIREVISFIRNIKKDVIILVDNCYGEFVEKEEPIEAGADIAAGSLIKNPGGGLAPSGGYIVGKEEYVENAAYRLTAPGIGKEAGPTLGILPLLFQGLFLAPQTVSMSLKSAIFAAKLFEEYGFETFPKWDDKRADIVQAVNLKSAENVINFCRGIQAASPVDSFVTPEPWDMPGYDCPVIMAAGTFVSGSSIELSADAPIKEPYTVFLQGGLSFYHGKLGILLGLWNMLSNNDEH